MMGHDATGIHSTQQEMVTDADYIKNQTDDVLRQHGASGTAAEVDALNSILNNINVQTKNQYHQG